MKFFRGKRPFKFQSEAAENEYRSAKEKAMKGFFKVFIIYVFDLTLV